MNTMTADQIRSLASVMPYEGSTAKVQARLDQILASHPTPSPALAGILDLVQEVLDRAAFLEGARPNGQKGVPLVKSVMVSELLDRIEAVLPLDSQPKVPE